MLSSSARTASVIWPRAKFIAPYAIRAPVRGLSARYFWSFDK